MSLKDFFILVVIFLMSQLCSCVGRTDSTNSDGLKTGNELDSASRINPTSIDIEPVIGLTDSVQVIFYDDPMGDSLRYSRYFTYVSTSDSAFLTLMKNELRQVPQVSMSVRSCRSEGKIYLFKSGDPIKTVFFSTKGDNCRYLYFIKNGLFYYVNLELQFSDELKKRQTTAIKP